MALAPSPARNASTAATSAGRSSRPMGCCAAKARAPGRSYRRALSSRMGVAVDPGLTAFAVTPVPPSSTARARTKPVTPALAAPYAASMGMPRVAAAEATARKRPCRGSGRRSMAGTATRARVSTPPRLMSSTACCCSSGSCQAGTPPAMTPAAATAASSPPQRSSASLTALARASGSRVSACAAMTAASPAIRAGVRDHAVQLAARPERVRQSCVVAAPVHRHDAPPARRQGRDGGRADAARRARDERDRMRSRTHARFLRFVGCRAAPGETAYWDCPACTVVIVTGGPCAVAGSGRSWRRRRTRAAPWG